MNLNKVFIYGNLTRDPELKATEAGTSVVNFAVATNRTYTTKEGVKSEHTEFHNVVAFAKIADVMAKYLKKGRAVFIEGRLQTRSWETEGVKHYRTEIVADSFQFGPQGGKQEAPATENDEDMSFVEEINPEDIPF